MPFSAVVTGGHLDSMNAYGHDGSLLNARQQNPQVAPERRDIGCQTRDREKKGYLCCAVRGVEER